MPESNFTCNNTIMMDMPNMQNDRKCKGDYKYPVTLDVTLP